MTKTVNLHRQAVVAIRYCEGVRAIYYDSRRVLFHVRKKSNSHKAKPTSNIVKCLDVSAIVKRNFC